MLKIKNLIETALEAIEEGGGAERFGEELARGLVRGAMRQLREELSVDAKTAKKARPIES